MNDQYRISTAPPPHRAATSHYRLTSTALWIGLAAGAVLNVGLQLIGPWILAAPFGAIAFGCGVALIVRAVAARKRR